MMGVGKFGIGRSYIGTATIDHNRKKVFQVVGRRGSVVSIMRVMGVRRELADVCGGTEITKIKDDDGFDYFLSANVPVDVDAAFDVVGMCR